MDFLVNVECLEGQFDTWGAFGRGFLGDVAKGGPTPMGAMKANISAGNLPYMEEVAPNEQVNCICNHFVCEICLSFINVKICMNGLSAKKFASTPPYYRNVPCCGLPLYFVSSY